MRDDNELETEQSGYKAEALRRLMVLRSSRTRRAQTPELSQQQKNMLSKMIPFFDKKTYVEVSPERAARIAQAYDEMIGTTHKTLQSKKHTTI